MPLLYSTQHKELVGSVNDTPYKVSFDADGIAEVDDAVAEQLLSADYGCTLIDEDGAEIKEIPAKKSKSKKEEKTEGSES